MRIDANHARAWAAGVANKDERGYLLTKAIRSGHQLEIDGKPVIEEQNDPVVVEESVTGT